MPGAFVIVRDARGSLTHVRRRDDGECVGCIEVGLYEIVRALLLADEAAPTARGGPDRAPPASVHRSHSQVEGPTTGKRDE